MPASATRLQKAFEADKRERQRRVGKHKQEPHIVDHANPSEMSEITGERQGHFQIPLKGGRSAILEVPLPAVEADLARIKGWIDLMNDVLTESRPSENSVEARRVDALAAIKQLQESAARSGRDRMTPPQIEQEIRRARRERK
jgi:hypothetical protein